MKNETNIDDFVKFYNFFPYNYGPFSNQFYFDLSDLQSHAYLDEELELRDSAFTKNKLSNYLKKAGIDYVHIPELGINSEYRKELKSDEDYAELFAFYSKIILPKQAKNFEELKKLGKQKRIVLLCFEQDKDHCHGGVISKQLEAAGVLVTHL